MSKPYERLAGSMEYIEELDRKQWQEASMRSRARLDRRAQVLWEDDDPVTDQLGLSGRTITVPVLAVWRADNSPSPSHQNPQRNSSTGVEVRGGRWGSGSREVVQKPNKI